MNEHDTEFDGTPADYYAIGGTLVVDETNVDLFRGGFLGLGGFYARQLGLVVGSPHIGHDHYINHLGLLARGQARVKWRNPSTGAHGIVEMRCAPAMFHIRADHWHEIEALTDDTMWFCLFAKSEADRVYGDAADVRWIMEKVNG